MSCERDQIVVHYTLCHPHEIVDSHFSGEDLPFHEPSFCRVFFFNKRPTGLEGNLNTMIGLAVFLKMNTDLDGHYSP